MATNHFPLSKKFIVKKLLPDATDNQGTIAPTSAAELLAIIVKSPILILQIVTKQQVEFVEFS